MDRQSQNIVFWSVLLLLLAGSVFGLTNRYVSGKPIEPLNGLTIGIGGIALMFFNAKLDSMEDLE